MEFTLILQICVSILTYLYVTNKLENIRLKKYIRESFQSMKEAKPDDLHYGKKEE